jgi:hypothetical protein
MPAFSLKSLLRVAAIVVAGIAANSVSAYANTIYSFTLVPNTNGQVGGSGTITLATPIPTLTTDPEYYNFDANQNGPVNVNSDETTLVALSITLTNGDTYSFSNEDPGQNAQVSFSADKLQNFSFNDTTLQSLDLGGNTYTFQSSYQTAAVQGKIVFNATPQVAATAPEPSSLMLLGTGLLGVAGVGRRKLVGR